MSGVEVWFGSWVRCAALQSRCRLEDARMRCAYAACSASGQVDPVDQAAAVGLLERPGGLPSSVLEEWRLLLNFADLCGSTARVARDGDWGPAFFCVSVRGLLLSSSFLFWYFCLPGCVLICCPWNEMVVWPSVVALERGEKSSFDAVLEMGHSAGAGRLRSFSFRFPSLSLVVTGGLVMSSAGRGPQTAVFLQALDC